MSTPLALIISVVLLALNGFFVAAEFALVASKRHRLEEAAAAGNRSARAAIAGVSELSLMLAGAQLGITLCTLGLGSLAEPAVAAQVRTGRLIRAATYAGFGEVPRPRLRLVSDNDDVDDADEDGGTGDEGEVVEFPHQSGRERAAAERRRREWEQRRRELRRELSSAQAAERRADEQLERAEAAERDAGHRVEDLDAELAELERRRTEAQADVARRKQSRRTAEREAAAARRQVGDVQAALEDLETDEPD